MGSAIVAGSIALVGFLLGGAWTAWVMQRSINRLPIFPMKIKKATVYVPTNYERNLKARQAVKRIKKIKEEEAMKEWKMKTGTRLSSLPLVIKQKKEK